MTIIDGKATAAQIKQEIAAEVQQMIANGMKRPHLSAVLIGHDGGSETYVRNKILACEACGFTSSLHRFEDDVTEDELLDCIHQLNNDPEVDGFIVQLPLPHHINKERIIEAIDYRKDVDKVQVTVPAGYMRRDTVFIKMQPNETTDTLQCTISSSTDAARRKIGEASGRRKPPAPGL